MKVEREREREITYKNMLTKLTSIFSTAAMDAIRQQDNISQSAEGKCNKKDALC